MTFVALKARVLNRGSAPDAFLTELVEWGRTAPDEIFAPRPAPKDANGNPLHDPDIYSKVRAELGPWEGLLARKAAEMEAIRVLALFESSCDWTEGVDTSRLGDDTPENSEAGAWQVSYDARRIAPELSQLLVAKGITNGIEFQQAMKFDHTLAMEFIARLMRHTTTHHGPLYKGNERLAIRKSLRGAENSIYPWLSRAATKEFETLLT